MAEFITIIGTLASIVGAGIAYWQAKKATSAAKSAKDARDTIIDKRETSELGELYKECQRVKTAVVSRIGPASQLGKLAGFDVGDTCAQVAAFANSLNEHQDLYADPNPGAENRAVWVSERLTELVAELSVQDAPDGIKEIGMKMDRELASFLPLAKQKAISRRETLQPLGAR